MKVQGFFFRGLLLLGLLFISLPGHTQDNSEHNKEIIETLYDSIAQKSFNILLNDITRVDFEGGFKTANLSLEKISDSLKKPNSKLKGVSAAAEYAESLIKERNSLLKNEKVLTVKDSFTNALDNIIGPGKIYSSNIYNMKYKDVGKYKILNKEVLKLISDAKDEFQEESKETKKENNTAKTNETEESSNQKEATSSFFLNLLGWIVLVLLLLSVFYNLLQSRKISRLKEKIAIKERVTKVEKMANPLQKAAPATKFTIEKANSIFETSFSAMLSNLNSEYSSHCVQTAQVENHKKQILDELANKSFSSETEAKSFIDQRINGLKRQIIEKIDDCRDRQTAQQIVDNEIAATHFRNPKLEEEEICAIVSRHKSNLKNSLLETIDAKELDRKMDTAREAIQQDIAKTIQQNLEYYISFFDTDGTIADTKKTKIRKRDSVVRFIVDPEDSTKATYTLLYDDPVMMKTGIQSYQGLLLPICNIEGAVNSNASSIVQVGNDGTLILSNGYWRVYEKLTIKII